MFALFKPIFESTWKRKETKIYLFFALLYPGLVLFASFLPPESNFLKPSVEAGRFFTFDLTYSIILSLVYNLVLPVLALFYLTYSVFKSEADSHIMFLYKDLSRKHVFGAKLLSLFLIVFIFLGLFTVAMLLVYYGRLAYQDIFRLDFFQPDNGETLSSLAYIVVTFIWDSFLGIIIAACASMYSGIGLTMTLAFTYSIGSSILSIFGVGFLVPRGLVSYVGEGASLLTALSISTLVTVIYSSVLLYVTFNYFKRLEF